MHKYSQITMDGFAKKKSMFVVKYILVEIQFNVKDFKNNS